MPLADATNAVVAEPEMCGPIPITGNALPRPRGRPSVGAKALREREQNQARVKKSRMKKKVSAVNTMEQEVRDMLNNMFLNLFRITSINLIRGRHRRFPKPQKLTLVRFNCPRQTQ